MCGVSVPGERELKPRIRAAWAFSGIDQRELASAVGIDYGTLRNYFSDARGGPPLEVAFKIADACEVPQKFMTEGWDVLISQPDLSPIREEVRKLQAAVEQGRRQHAESVDELHRLRADTARSQRQFADLLITRLREAGLTEFEEAARAAHAQLGDLLNPPDVQGSSAPRREAGGSAPGDIQS